MRSRDAQCNTEESLHFGSDSDVANCFMGYVSKMAAALWSAVAESLTLKVKAQLAVNICAYGSVLVHRNAWFTCKKMS